MERGKYAHHTVPIRHNCYAKVSLPKELTSVEAEKLIKFIESQVVPEQTDFADLGV